jgi:hypothetical protein
MVGRQTLIEAEFNSNAKIPCQFAKNGHGKTLTFFGVIRYEKYHLSGRLDLRYFDLGNLEERQEAQDD